MKDRSDNGDGGGSAVDTMLEIATPGDPLPDAMAEELVRLSNRNGRKWFTIAHRILSHWATDVDAEEVVEDAMDQVRAHWRRFDPERGTLARYCTVVVVSKGLDRRRRLRARALAQQKMPPPARPPAHADLELAERARRLYREIPKLPAAQREAVEAYLCDERDRGRERMKDNMRAALARAKRKLRVLMMPPGGRE